MAQKSRHDVVPHRVNRTFMGEDRVRGRRPRIERQDREDDGDDRSANGVHLPKMSSGQHHALANPDTAKEGASPLPAAALGLSTKAELAPRRGRVAEERRGDSDATHAEDPPGNETADSVVSRRVPDPHSSPDSWWSAQGLAVARPLQIVVRLRWRWSVRRVG